MIFDLCPNEQLALDTGLHNAALSEAVFEFYVAWCGSRGLVPVILIIPSRHHAERMIDEPGYSPGIRDQ